MDEMFGKSQKHLTNVPNSKIQIHRDALPEFLQLKEWGISQGFDLRIISGFRDYERQLHIWNSKAKGQRPLLNDAGETLPFDELSPEEILFAILRWSAIPGFSRHHWGTDIDVYDHNSLPSKDYQVKLTPDEVSNDGPFGALHQWLDQLMEEKRTEFFRPYAVDRGSVAPERWHLSYSPAAKGFESLLSIDLFINQITHSEVLLREEILKNAEEIFFKYIICP